METTLNGCYKTQIPPDDCVSFVSAWSHLRKFLSLFSALTKVTELQAPVLKYNFTAVAVQSKLYYADTHLAHSWSYRTTAISQPPASSSWKSFIPGTGGSGGGEVCIPCFNFMCFLFSDHRKWNHLLDDTAKKRSSPRVIYDCTKSGGKTHYGHVWNLKWEFCSVLAEIEGVVCQCCLVIGEAFVRPIWKCTIQQQWADHVMHRVAKADASESA